MTTKSNSSTGEQDMADALAVVRKIDQHFESSERLRLGRWVAPDERARTIASYIAKALQHREQEVRERCAEIADKTVTSMNSITYPTEFAKGKKSAAADIASQIRDSAQEGEQG